MKVTILCEDITHERFVRRYLICRGISERNIFPYPNLKGKKVNNNNAFVVSNYAKIVKSYRAIKNSQDTAVIVMIDADNKTIHERMKTFHTALDPEKGELNNDTRRDSEKIAIFIPARNIETWFYYINSGADCDQSTDYKQEKYDSLSKREKIQLAEESAIKLARDICAKGLQDNAPLSLQYACQELTKIL